MTTEIPPYTVRIETGHGARPDKGCVRLGGAVSDYAGPMTPAQARELARLLVAAASAAETFLEAYPEAPVPAPLPAIATEPETDDLAPWSEDPILTRYRGKKA